MGLHSDDSQITLPSSEWRELRHNLRTPLNQIIGYSEMLQDDADERLIPDLQKITQAGRKLVKLLDQLSARAQPVRGAQAQPTPVEPPGKPAAARARLTPAATPGEPAAAGGAAVPSRAARAHSSRYGDTLAMRPEERFAAVAPEPAATSPEPAATSPERPQPRLLVVDDNDLNRDMLARRLRTRGYDIQTAAGGQEALIRIAGGGFDLVMLDVMMPDISGLEVLKTLREEHSRVDLPIIMVTALDASQDVVDALRLGANDYVTKPLDFSVALARVETQLALKQARDEVEVLNRRLIHAQDRLDRMAEAEAGSVEDIAQWSTVIAGQIAEAIEADALEVTIFDGSDPVLPPASRAAGSVVHDLHRVALDGKKVVRPSHLVLPIAGPGQQVFGALVVYWTGQRRRLRDPDRRLLDSFVRQLGGALELRHLRHKLDEAAEQRRIRQQELLDRGVDLLRVCPSCKRCFDQRPEICPDDGAALSPPRSFPFRVAGRYRLERIRGEGGMGTIYRAVDERLSRDVAIKIIKAEHFHNASVRRRFDYEARAVARIDHPGVVAVFDSGEIVDGSLFIVMEWLEGEDLFDVVAEQGPGSLAQVAALVAQGGDALNAAHDKGLLHRDIKPENIFLVPTEWGFKTKLLDFGIAKELAPTSSELTQTGSLLGTPRFMAPEQLLQKPVDTRSDLYSFAAVVYQALTGRQVVAAEELCDVFYDAVHTMPPAPSTLRSDVTAEVDEVLLWALAKRPEDRPESLSFWSRSLAELLRPLHRSGPPEWRLAPPAGRPKARG